MKVLLKKSTEDMNWGGDDYDVITLHPISKALTDCYLPQWSLSPLKAMLMQRFGTIKQMYLFLKVMCEDNIVKSISIRCNLLNDVERMYENKVDWKKVMECLTEYFHSIGFAKIECTKAEEISDFIQRMKKDIPITENYFEIIDN